MRSISRRKLAIGVVAIGVIVLLGIWLTSVQGVVYMCSGITSDCQSTSQPAAGRTVYLVAGDNYGPPSRILQTTTTGISGYFLFVGAPSSYTVAVDVGEFESGTMYNLDRPLRRYCVFTLQFENTRFHRVEIRSPESTQAFIDDFGGSPMGGPLPCPE